MIDLRARLIKILAAAGSDITNDVAIAVNETYRAVETAVGHHVGKPEFWKQVIGALEHMITRIKQANPDI